jgi:hypothetical protein
LIQLERVGQIRPKAQNLKTVLILLHYTGEYQQEISIMFQSRPTPGLIILPSPQLLTTECTRPLPLGQESTLLSQNAVTTLSPAATSKTSTVVEEKIPINEVEKKLDDALAECDLIIRKSPYASRINVVNFAASHLLQRDLFLHVKKTDKRCSAHYTPSTLSESKRKKYLSGWDDIHFLPLSIRNYLYILYHLTKNDFTYINDTGLFTPEKKDHDKARKEMIKIIRDLILMTYDCFKICLQLHSIVSQPERQRPVSIAKLVASTIYKIKKMTLDDKLILPAGSSIHQIYLLIEKQALDNGEENVTVTVADTSNSTKIYPKDHPNFPDENFSAIKEGLVKPRTIGMISTKSDAEVNSFAVYLTELFNTYSAEDFIATNAVYDINGRLKKPHPLLVHNSYYTKQIYPNCVTFNWVLLLQHTIENASYFSWLHTEEKACMDLSIDKSSLSPPLDIEASVTLDSTSYRLRILFFITRESTTSYLDPKAIKLLTHLAIPSVETNQFDSMIAECKHITRANLSGKNITDANIDDVIFVLKLLPQVRLINLTQNKLSSVSVAKIIDYLKDTACKVKTIHLQHNLMDHRCKEMIQLALHTKWTPNGSHAHPSRIFSGPKKRKELTITEERTNTKRATITSNV